MTYANVTVMNDEIESKKVVKREMPHLQIKYAAIRSPHIIMSQAYSTRKLSVRTTKKWVNERYQGFS